MNTVKKLFSLDSNLAQELENVAKALGKTQKDVIENALDFYFDYTDSIIADNIVNKVQSGEMKTSNAKDVYDRLGIDV